MKALIKLSRALGKFRDMDSTMPTQVMAIFLAVAKSREPLEETALPNMTGMLQASVNRALKDLSVGTEAKSKRGLKLVVQRPHPLDARKNIVELTPKGHKLVADIEEIING